MGFLQSKGPGTSGRKLPFGQAMPVHPSQYSDRQSLVSPPTYRNFEGRSELALRRRREAGLRSFAVVLRGDHS